MSWVDVCVECGKFGRCVRFTASGESDKYICLECLKKPEIHSKYQNYNWVTTI